MFRGEHLLKGDYETPKNDLMVALATATAKALAVAKKTATDEACFAGVQVTGETSLDDVVTNYAECTSAGVGFSLNYAKDAMAEAGAPPLLFHQSSATSGHTLRLLLVPGWSFYACMLC